MYDLKGRTVLITGAARGVGAALARAVAARGARVALMGLEPERLAGVAAQIGPDAAWWEADVTDRVQVAEAVAAAAARFGGLDVVVANAGINSFGTVAEMDPDRFRRVIDVNLIGAWHTLRAAVPYVRERRGYVLVMASMAACLQAPLQAHYAASKAGVAALANSLRVELRPAGTAVGVAYITFINTDMMLRDTLADPAGWLVWDGNRSPLFRMIPVERAVRALVRGIERRARTIVAPRRMLPLVWAPGLFQPIFERLFPDDRVEAARHAAGHGQAMPGR